MAAPGRGRRTHRRNDDPPQQRFFLSRAAAVASRHGAPRRGAHRGGPSARRLRAGAVARPGEHAARQGRPGRAGRISAGGGSEHGQRQATQGNDLRSAVPQGAGDRRQDRRGTVAGASRDRRGRGPRLGRICRALEEISRVAGDRGAAAGDVDPARRDGFQVDPHPGRRDRRARGHPHQQCGGAPHPWHRVPRRHRSGPRWT